jgi:hypothetical protein
MDAWELRPDVDPGVRWMEGIANETLVKLQEVSGFFSEMQVVLSKH